MLVLIRGILLQFINKFSLFFKNQSRCNYKGTESFHVRYLWMLAGFSAKSAKKSVVRDEPLSFYRGGIIF